MQDYVEKRDGGFYVTSTRVALDGIVYAFRNGASPETILRSFPLLGSLERVYGAITFYLANQSAVEQYLDEQEKLWREMNSEQSQLSAGLIDRIQSFRSNLVRS